MGLWVHVSDTREHRLHEREASRAPSRELKRVSAPKSYSVDPRVQERGRERAILLLPFLGPSVSAFHTVQYLRRHLRSLRSQTPSPPPGRLRWHARRRVCCSPPQRERGVEPNRSGRLGALPGCQGVRRTCERCLLAARAGCGAATVSTLFANDLAEPAHTRHRGHSRSHSWRVYARG